MARVHYAGQAKTFQEDAVIFFDNNAGSATKSLLHLMVADCKPYLQVRHKLDPYHCKSKVIMNIVLKDCAPFLATFEISTFDYIKTMTININRFCMTQQQENA